MSAGMKLVGKIQDAHGLRGELYVLIFSGETSWLDDLEEFGLGPLPPPGQAPTAGASIATYECERAKDFKQGFILKASQISDRNQAEAVKGKGFYIPEDLLISEPGETIYLAEILGFSVFAYGDQKIGEIVSFSSNGPQDLLVVRTPDGKDFEIPFVDAFIDEILYDERRIQMDLPEGLLE